MGIYISTRAPKDTYYLSLKKHTLAQILVRSEHSTSSLYVQNVFWLRSPHSGTLKFGLTEQVLKAGGGGDSGTLIRKLCQTSELLSRVFNLPSV